MLNRLRRPGTLAIVVALAMIVALPASAVLLEDGEENEDTPLVSHDFYASEDDEGVNVLVFAVNEPGDDPVDCTLPEDIEFAVDEEGTVTFTLPDGDNGDGGDGGDDGGEEPAPLEGCTLVLAENKNGKTNHGQVVSAFVHALKAAFQEEGLQGSMPFGQYVKEIAGSDHGKKHADDDDEGLVEAQGKGKNKNKPGKGKGKNK